MMLCLLHGTRTAGDNIAFQRPLHLDDGRPHVAVLSCDRSGTNKAYLMVDGMLNIFSLARNPALANTDSFKLFFGRRAGAGYFEGDIAEFAWFGGGEPLTPAQMMALSKDLAQKYGARLYDRDAYRLSDIASYGLGATNVSVAAAADSAYARAREVIGVNEQRIAEYRAMARACPSLHVGVTL